MATSCMVDQVLVGDWDHISVPKIWMFDQFVSDGQAQLCECKVGTLHTNCEILIGRNAW
jgi:hypothetical protein